MRKIDHFSVLMSVYINDKSADFKLALESVTIKQTLKPSQVVIVFDGAVKPEIPSIIECIKKADKSIEYTVLVKNKNEGLAKALNDGFKLCKCDWIARMDADDIARPERFDKQCSFLSNHEDVDMLGGAIAEFNIRPGDIDSVRSVKTSHQDIVEMAKTRNPFNHMTIFYSKKAVESVNGYSESLGKLEDYKLWLDMIFANYKLANISDILVDVRVGSGFIERRSNTREIHDWDKLQKYLLKNKFINIFKAIKNCIAIRLFIYMPPFFKKIVYKIFLRKNKDIRV